MQTHSFTAKADCISRILETEILICQSFDPASTPAHQHPKLFPFNAIWDTGATGSVITKKVAQQCGLVPIGMTEVYHAQGKSLTNIYLVNIYLPHGVLIAGLRVSEGDLNSFDALSPLGR